MRRRGELAQNAVLSEELILELVELFKAGTPISELAKSYQLNDSVVRRCLEGKTWGHLHLMLSISGANSRKRAAKMALKLKALGVTWTDIARVLQIPHQTLMTVVKSYQREEIRRRKRSSGND